MSNENLTHVGGGSEGNRYGAQIERKVAALLTGLPIVRRVLIIPKNSWEDRQMIDLRVDLDQVASLAIDQVAVQVKASTRGHSHFKETLAHKLKSDEDISSLDRQTWLMANRMILLVCGTKVSKTGNTRRSVSDEEIVDDFTNQLAAIDAYWHGKNDK